MRVRATAVDSAAPLELRLVWWGRVAAAMVLLISAVDWVGWAAGIGALTRGFPSWPQMTPWTAVLVALLAVAILVQSGRQSTARVWTGCGLAAGAGILCALFLMEYVTGRSSGLDLVWFPDSVRALQASWPGRPSPQTATSVLLMSVGAGLMRADRRWSQWVWALVLAAAAAVPIVVVTGYVFRTLSLVRVTPSTGMGISTALAVLLLVSAALLTRPDRHPVAWLLTRPDRMTLVRLGGILAGFPLLIGLIRLALVRLGLRDDPAWVLSISAGSIVLGAAAFYYSQREQRLLIEKELLRAEAEKRYRILAENAVDIVVHLHHGALVRLHGTEVVWISPSVRAAFGDAPQAWIGTDFANRVHAEDRDVLAAALSRILPGEPVLVRVRMCTTNGGFHWVDCHAKPYIDDEGNIDGVIAALRVVDDQVEAQRQLERLARFDALTGLVNRAETIARLEAALNSPRSAGPHLGVLFCDIDHFKTINDTWGHIVGDIALSTVADRIRDCVRAGDTVGRVGGDEIVVLLPGLHSIDEAAQIAEKIRCRVAEPIRHEGGITSATVSIGATVVHPGESVSAITARADTAMYEAKKAGRNAVKII